MPWRNGGGTTTEILVEPEAGDLVAPRFLYRVSIADVASDGPFSRFAGYDRHIMLVGGTGMTLDAGTNGRIALSTPFEPQAFSGDWDVTGTLVDGPVRDFNLIVDRARASATLESLVLTAPTRLACEPGAVTLVHVFRGTLADADEGDTLVVDEPTELVPVGDARVAIAIVCKR